MRFAWYAGVSTALAASVVVSAFHQRANFYSAMVYLAQSNLCLLVLINFFYLIYGTVMYGLQRLLYGSLRQTEVEQLSERAWFAITETCLVMTIFRDEIGAWFLVMITALITGKVWGWIGDGRVEILEQQPPANPGLFHTRLSISLLLSLAYDVWILNYAVKTVIRQARPDMMVMFLFEFAVLATTSARTGIRYLVSVLEHRIIKEQTKKRLEERREEVRQQREEILRQREQNPDADASEPLELPREEDIDEMDIEVPGWENKGQWILLLDLVADCTKLSIYVVFFFILFSFNGLPIHIMRDLFMTGRSVIQRGTALWKYRRAVEDMNKYADATAEDLAREDTCIICREDMRPWDPVANPAALQRIRPKKLPCGHILHMGCLKSWLERQQVCPTCRRSVVISNPGAVANRDGVLQRVGLGALGAAPAAGQPGQQPPAANRPAPVQPAPRPGGARIFNFGALRVGFAQGGENIQDLAQRMNEPRGGAAAAPAAQPVPAPTPTITATPPDMDTLRAQLAEMERALQRQAQELQQDQQQFQLLNLLFAELARVRQHQQVQQMRQQRPENAPGDVTQHAYLNQIQGMGENAWIPPMSTGHRTPTLTRHGVAPNAAAIPAGSPDLPDGVVLPAGWSLMPLQRLDGAGIQQPPTTETPAATATTNGNGTAAPQTQDAELTPTRTEPATATNGAARAPRDPSRNGSRHPDIIAPNPVLPNWAGENQLFGHNGSSSREPSGDPPVAASTTSEKAPTIGGPRADDEDSSKGKAKAVTVEDAEDEDEE
ncbi:E3 ubiquitin-protein ligase HRD1 [Plectosphaerella plurivora]|uniref:RING-type E3 ubiquitin transferase n=1 Tax=Plectosphaerella plurivora TaxID=936078 RepID=A0A9P9A7N7_9PEZI|nr:E3 ubiquitin-protein ligase HRD1 [Plectosphaerella plurivora]